MDSYQQGYGPGPMGGMPAGPGSSLPPEAPKGRGKGKGKEKKAAKKVVDKQVRFALIFALAAGGAGAYAAFGTQQPDNYVVRAASPINALQPVDQSFLEAVPMDGTLVVEGAIVADSEAAALELAKNAVTGQRASVQIRKGEQIVPDRFGAELPLVEPLTPTERLVSVTARVSNAVAGQINAGDRVDIVASTGELSGVIATNVQIVSVTASEDKYQAAADAQTGDGLDTRPETLLPGDPVPGMYVLRVAAADAARLSVADLEGDLSLIYRPADGSDMPTGPLSLRDVICGTASTDACG